MIRGLTLRCPKCGREARYSSADFRPAATTGTPSGGEPSEAEPSPAAEQKAQEAEAQERFEGFGVVPPEDRSPHES